MRRVLRPPREGGPGFARLPAHVVVRDYPESLAVFREAGVDLGRWGGEAVAEWPGDVDALLDRLAEVTGWRVGAGGGPGPGAPGREPRSAGGP